MAAFQMSYTAPVGQLQNASNTTIANSYWIPAQFSVNPGQLVFKGYNSAADYQAGARPIGNYTYNFSSAAFQAFVSSYQLSTAQLAYIAANGTLPPGTIAAIALAYVLTLDSFFSTATIVS